MTFAECQERYGGGGTGNSSVIDLGVLLSADVQAVGFVKLQGVNGEQLDIPGRLIDEIFFTPDHYLTQDSAFDNYFATQNTIINDKDYALGVWTVSDSSILDSAGVQIAGYAPLIGQNGGYGSAMRIRDTGPLFAVMHLYGDWYGGYVEWGDGTPYTIQESLVKNGFLQAVTTNGVSGGTEPTWNDTPFATTNDGSVVWTNQGAIATVGTIHAYARVIDLPGVTIPRVNTIEFVQQPTNVVAGETISPSVTVRVLDQDANPYLILPVTVKLDILGAGTLASFTNYATADPVTGIATFDSLSIAEAGTGYVLRSRVVHAINIPTIDSDPFDVTAP